MKGKKIIFGKKSQILIYISWFIVALLIIVITAVLAPAGVMFNTKMYEAGEKIYLKTNSSMNISNTEVNARVQNVLNAGFDNLETNIDISGDLFQYGWILLLVISTLSVFIYVLRIKEIQGGGYV